MATTLPIGPAHSSRASPSCGDRSADGWFLASWAVTVAAVAGWVITLIPVWSSKPDLADRFLIPLASAWLIWRAVPRLLSMSPRPQTWGLLPLAAGAAAFAVGWFVAVQVSGRPIVVWWLTASLMLLVLGLALLHLGFSHARLLVFPVLFVVFSLPTPGRVYNPLMLRLKQFTTSSAHIALPWLGVPCERPDPAGFELTLPSGSLGVVEACSGVRSVTALTAIAVLVAYLRGFGLFRGGLLVGLTVGVIAVTNALRVILTGLIQEHFGRAAIEGWAHEALGIGVILVGLGLIVALATLLSPRPVACEPIQTVGSLRQSGNSALARAGLALAVLTPALVACMWAEQFRISHRVTVRLEELSRTIGPWRGTDLPVNEAIAEELLCDQIVNRSYRNAVGEEVNVWVMFWGNAATTAHMHHPDICYPFRGWKVTTSQVQPIQLIGGGELPVSMRHYAKPEMQQALFFWTQNGSFVLPDGVEKAEMFSGHSWLFELFQYGHRPVDSGARISVLIGTTTRGSVGAGEKLLRGFTQQFAGELYQLCPWARPTGIDAGR
ncbi:MAG: EpsI family protein [Gemmataceae bacterium]|nr:EpsI family protein [Gemmataceae bacterium]